MALVSWYPAALPEKGTFALMARYNLWLTRVFFLTFKALAALFAVLALLLVFLSWRIAMWAVNKAEISSTIETVAAFLVPSLHTQVDRAVLAWDQERQLLTLVVGGVSLNNMQGRPVATARALDVHVRPRNLIRGRVIPYRLTAEDIKVWLVRDAQGMIAPERPSSSASGGFFRPFMDGLFLRSLAGEMAHPWLRQNINISHVEIFVRDEKDGQDWSIAAPSITFNHQQRNSSGQARFELVEKEKTSGLQLSYQFDFDARLHKIGLDFQNIRPASFAAHKFNLDVLKVADFPVSGAIKIHADRSFNVSSASFKIDGGAGILADTSLWEAPRKIKSLKLEALYDKSKATLSVPVAKADFDGPQLGMKFEMKMPTPKDLVWRSSRRLDGGAFTFHLTLDRLLMDEFTTLWPKPLLPDVREWMAESLSGGVYDHAEVTIKGRARLNDLENINLDSLTGHATAHNGRVRYLEGMPAVENAAARATFGLDKIDIHILKGNIKDVQVQPFTIVIGNLRDEIETITLPIAVKGPVRQVLEVIDSPPLGFAKEIGLDPSITSGVVDGVVTLAFPLINGLTFHHVKLKAKAKVRNFGVPEDSLIPRIALSRGAFDLDLTEKGLNLKGKISLNDVSAQLDWRSNFQPDAKGKIPFHDGTLRALVDGAQWGRFYDLHQLAKVTGSTPVTLRYKRLQSGFSTLEGQVTLTPAAVALYDIGWQKNAGVEAVLSFRIEIEDRKNLRVPVFEIKGKDAFVQGNFEFDDKTGQLVAMRFKPFHLGRSRAQLLYEKPVDPTKPLVLHITGDAFDMNGMDFDGPMPAQEPEKMEERKRPRRYVFRLNRLYTNKNGFLDQLKGYAQRDSVGWVDIDLTALALGKTPLTIRLEPAREEKPASFKLIADNLGVALEGMGMGKIIRHGEVEIRGKSPPGSPRRLEGTIRIGSFVVTDLPVLARILSAVSPLGLIDVITGEASFDRLRGNYIFEGRVLSLKDVRAQGSVYGININGDINVETGQTSLSGTIVPFSFVNNVIGAIPLLGRVITGGKGQGILSATFRVKGNISNPDVSVNPVSLLTPGILRSLFFSDNTKPVDTPLDEE